MEKSIKHFIILVIILSGAYFQKTSSMIARYQKMLTTKSIKNTKELNKSLKRPAKRSYTKQKPTGCQNIITQELKNIKDYHDAKEVESWHERIVIALEYNPEKVNNFFQTDDLDTHISIIKKMKSFYGNQLQEVNGLSNSNISIDKPQINTIYQEVTDQTARYEINNQHIKNKYPEVHKKYNDIFHAILKKNNINHSNIKFQIIYDNDNYNAAETAFEVSNSDEEDKRKQLVVRLNLAQLSPEKINPESIHHTAIHALLHEIMHCIEAHTNLSYNFAARLLRFENSKEMEFNVLEWLNNSSIPKKRWLSRIEKNTDISVFLNQNYSISFLEDILKNSALLNDNINVNSPVYYQGKTLKRKSKAIVDLRKLANGEPVPLNENVSEEMLQKIETIKAKINN